MFHLILSLLFMANALHTLIDYDSDHIGIYFSGVLLAVTALAVTIICLIRQKKSNLAPGIQRWTWVCMGYYVCWFGMTMVFSMYLFINHPETMDDTWQMIDLAVKYSPGEPIWLHYAYLINFILAVVISVSGLLLVSRHIREERRLSSGRETG